MGVFHWNIIDIEFYYIESFLFFGLSVLFPHYRIKYLLFKVKFRMYMCSLLIYDYENF